MTQRSKFSYATETRRRYFALPFVLSLVNGCASIPANFGNETRFEDDNVVHLSAVERQHYLEKQSRAVERLEIKLEALQKQAATARDVSPTDWKRLRSQLQDVRADIALLKNSNEGSWIRYQTRLEHEAKDLQASLTRLSAR